MVAYVAQDCLDGLHQEQTVPLDFVVQIRRFQGQHLNQIRSNYFESVSSSYDPYPQRSGRQYRRAAVVDHLPGHPQQHEPYRSVRLVV